MNDKLIWWGGGGREESSELSYFFPFFFHFCFATTHTTDNGFFRTQLTKTATGPHTHTRAQEKKDDKHDIFRIFPLFIEADKNEEAHFGHTKETSYITFFYLLIQILRPGD